MSPALSQFVLALIVGGIGVWGIRGILLARCALDWEPDRVPVTVAGLDLATWETELADEWFWSEDVYDWLTDPGSGLSA